MIASRTYSFNLCILVPISKLKENLIKLMCFHELLVQNINDFISTQNQGNQPASYLKYRIGITLIFLQSGNIVSTDC